MENKNPSVNVDSRTCSKPKRKTAVINSLWALVLNRAKQL